jgi:hypothetical protein
MKRVCQEKMDDQDSMLIKTEWAFGTREEPGISETKSDLEIACTSLDNHI